MSGPIPASAAYLYAPPPTPAELCAFGAAFSCDTAQWEAALHNTPIVSPVVCVGNNDIPLAMPLGPRPRWVREKPVHEYEY
jgi:hypothetical protein